jgi:hypothetical protein
MANDLGGALAELGGLGDMTVTETVRTVGKVLDGLDKGQQDGGKSIGDAVEGLGGLFGDKKKK